MAAERIGRRAYAMDIEPRYVDVAVRRWQAFTGKDAVNAESGRTFDQLAERAGAVGPACQGDHSETNVTAAISADPSPDIVVLQALLCR
jgi:hypothetical protein